MFYTVEQIKEKITPALKRYGVKKAYLFGSYAKGEQTNKSDIDILIEKGKLKSLFELCGLQEDLSKLLDKQVDLLTAESLDYRNGDAIHKKFKHNLKNERQLLYEERQCPMA